MIDPATGERIVVAAGAPCPEHGKPADLISLGGQLYSQCEGCREAFLVWFAGCARHVVVNPGTPLVAPKKPQLGLDLTS